MFKSNVNKRKQNCCVLCNVSTSDVVRLGPMFQLDDLMVHYRCVLFTKRLECVFCNENGATSGCCFPECNIVFHYPCGLTNGVLSQFKEPYSLFCPEHRPPQPSTKRFLQENELTDLKCNLCSEEVEIDLQYQEFLVTPCCHSIYHRDCLQNHVISEEITTLCCPNCKNEKEFRRDMLDYGIYLPREQSHQECTTENSDSSAFSDENEQMNLSMMHMIHLSADEANDRSGDSEPIFNNPGASEDVLYHKSATTIEMAVDQEDKEMVFNNQATLEAQPTDPIDQVVESRSPPRYTLHQECENSGQISINGGSPVAEISRIPESVGKSHRPIKKKASTPKNSRLKKSPGHNRKRKSPTSLSSDSQNSSPSGMSQFESPKIGKNGKSWSNSSESAGPSRRNLFLDNSISLDESREDEEIQIIECSEDPHYQEALKEAKEILSTALVLPNGRVNLKVCKLCGYVTLAKGSRTYNHKIFVHPDFKKLAEDLFDIETYKKDNALSKLTQHIYKSNLSKSGANTADGLPD